MRAEVLQREDLVAVAGDGDVVGADGHAEGLVGGHLVEGAGADEGHAIASASSRSTFLASSASTVAISLLLDRRHADLADQVVEEAVHDEAAGFLVVDAARAEVEQLLVVEAGGGRRVAGAGDLAGLDLEVGHRVGVAAVGEHEVAVLLVGLDALGDLADQHVADPDRVRALALQRALVERRCSWCAARCGRRRAGARCAGPRRRSRGRAARPSRRDRRSARWQSIRTTSPPKRDRHVLVRRIATDERLVVREVDGVVGPVLHRDDRDVGTVADDDLDDGRDGGRAGVVETTMALLCAPKRSAMWPASVAVERRRPSSSTKIGSATRRRPARRRAASRAPRPARAPRTGCWARVAHAAQRRGLVAGDDPRCARPRACSTMHCTCVPAERRVGVQAAQPLERGEAPDLLAPGGDGVVGDVEGALRVQVALDLVSTSRAERTDSVTVTNSLSRTGRRGGASRRISRPRPPSAARSGG